MELKNFIQLILMVAGIPLILYICSTSILIPALYKGENIEDYINLSRVGMSFLILVICYTIYRFAFAPFSFFKKLGLPYATAEPVLGNIREMVKLGLHQLHLNYLVKFGNVFGFFIGRRPILVIADPDLLKEILIRDSEKFINRFVAFKPKAPLHHSLLFLKDGDWKRVRSVLSPTFTSGKLKQTAYLIEECLEKLLENLSKAAEASSSTEIWSMYGKFTLDVIMSAAFGKRLDVQYGKRNTKLDKKLYSFFQFSNLSRALDVLDPPDWLRKLVSHHITSRDPSYLVGLLKPVLEERKETNMKSRYDFLDFMLTENSAGSAKLTDDEIMAQAMTFLLAGYDTTSNALSYTTYLLALNPSIQEKLYQEVKEKFKGDWNESSPIYERIQTLKYLDQVFSEALRLYPPGYFLIRKAREDFYVNGVSVPPAVEIMVPVYAIHHNPNFWDDPEKFDPERFSLEAKSNRHSCIYLPFGNGPRNCIGMRFALLEAKIALANIIKRFEFEKCSDTRDPLPLNPGVTLSPKHGIHIKLVCREKS